MTLYKGFELPSEIPVSHVGVHPIRWHEHPDQPTAGFAPVDVEALAVNITTEVLKRLNRRGGFDDLWGEIDPEVRTEIIDELKNSIEEILEGLTI
jgi:hypothetical protein